MSGPRALTLALSLLGALACAVRAAELPGGHVLLRDAVSEDGRVVAAFAPEPGDRCWLLRLFERDRGRWTLAAEGAGPPRPRSGSCSPVVGVLAGNGRVAAVYAPWEAQLVVLERDRQYLRESGRITLPGQMGKPFPPPGQTLALARDASALLVGAPHHDCVLAVPEDACGVAYLFRRNGRAWRLELRIPRPPDARATDRFARTLALSRNGQVAIVGGPGSWERAGRLWVYARAADGGWDLLETLDPLDPRDLEFGSEVATDAAGEIVAVAADQRVLLFRRRGDLWPRVAALASNEPSLGTFGGALALSSAGNLLVVGAPRSACPEEKMGIRCGAVRLFSLRRSGGGLAVAEAGALEPVMWAALADFGWRVASDAAGRLIAVQGKLAHLFDR